MRAWNFELAADAYDQWRRSYASAVRSNSSSYGVVDSIAKPLIANPLTAKPLKSRHERSIHYDKGVDPTTWLLLSTTVSELQDDIDNLLKLARSESSWTDGNSSQELQQEVEALRHCLDQKDQEVTTLLHCIEEKDSELEVQDAWVKTLLQQSEGKMENSESNRGREDNPVDYPEDE